MKTLIDRTFRRLLVPSLLMVFGISISEFVDAMIVAWLLGSTAMSVVNLCSPVAMFAAAVASVAGVGGSTLFAGYVGAFDSHRAKLVYSVSLIASFIFISVVSAGIAFFSAPFNELLCEGNSELASLSHDYLLILIMSLPLLVTVNVIVIFLPSAGCADLGTFLIIMANVINVILDVVFIKFFDMGLAGAALATATGYLVCLIVFLFCKPVYSGSLRLIRTHIRDFSELRKVCSMGSSSALSQISFAVKFAFCNAVALKLGGGSGLVAVSVCLQLMSIASIFVGGISSALMRICAYLKGQNDYENIFRLCKRAYIMQLLCSVVYVSLFIYFSSFLLKLYNVIEPEAVLITLEAVYIFSVSLIFRSVCITFMFYIQSMGRSVYASSISILDGFGILIPVSLVLCPFMGLDGLWWSMLASTVLLLVIILITNTVTVRRYPERYRSLLLVGKDCEAVEIIGWSGFLNADNISGLSSRFINTVPGNALAALLQFLNVNMLKKNNGMLSDILVRKCDDGTYIEARCDCRNPVSLSYQTGETLQITYETAFEMNTILIISRQGTLSDF